MVDALGRQKAVAVVKKSGLLMLLACRAVKQPGSERVPGGSPLTLGPASSWYRMKAGHLFGVLAA